LLRAASSGRAGQVRSARSPKGEDERCLRRPEDGAYCPGPLPGYGVVGGFGLVDGAVAGCQAFLRTRGDMKPCGWCPASGYGAIHIVGRTSGWWAHAVPRPPQVSESHEGFCKTREVPSRRV
jgi:hypothetical protein